MAVKPNIAVITGGDSSEIVISLKSGENIFKAIDESRFVPWLVKLQGKKWEVLIDGKTIEINKSDFSFTFENKKIQFDYAYITIHGTPGEDGILQGYLELLKIPYSTCDLHSSSLTFNKWYCSNYLRNFGIKMANSIKITKGEKINQEQIVKKISLPMFIKPNAGGSSFGVTKVKTISEIEPAINKAFEESDEALVEAFIEGTEFTCGLVKLSDKEYIFPITEVLPKNEFFDFEAKYTAGVTEEITPARLPENLFKKCQQISSQIYDLCNCSGIVRVDYILKGEEFYFLEVNTTPGMTGTSFIPQQIKAMGFTLSEILTEIILDGLKQN
ncbi:MAG: D-alanine--D-alanine ligase [Prolixibacteraceae bacterium]|nr:D-alanine--D-alanine ligase [Prolixibacteraceae bacterium]MBN2774327.1 D-alanine--D-alanine ligase [Prolixibacteraceae bacterium]